LEKALEQVRGRLLGLDQGCLQTALLILELNRSLQKTKQVDTLRVFWTTHCPQERSKFGLASFLANSGRDDRVGIPQIGGILLG